MTTNTADGLDAARTAAAQHLRAGGYHDEAALVAAGQGDDFAEVRMALSLWAIMSRPPAPPASPPTKRLGRRLVGEEC